MAKVLCIGIAVLDYIYAVGTMPTRGEKYRAKDLAVVGGGIAANAAVAVARLGGEAELITRLGSDGTAREIVEELNRYGVRTDRSLRLWNKRSPVSAIFIDDEGERMIMSYADTTIPDSIEELPQVLPVGVNAVLGDTRWEAGALHLFRLARARGVPALLDGDRAPQDPEILAAPTHIAFSAQGLRGLTGIDDLGEALARVAKGNTNWLAVTDGPNGVWWTEAGRIRHEGAYRIKAVDTLGAGDTWHGAFALALAEGMAEAPAIRFASATAALKCLTFGGRAGIPDRASVEAFMKNNSIEETAP
jgi:sulfofructose kinase